MSYWPGLYGGGGFYLPDPWQTTWVSQHFPEHHYPLEHTRHAIGRAFGGLVHDFAHAGPNEHTMICPRSDIRESMTTFYVDVELPGLASEEQLKLKWIGSRTLLLRAAVTRAATPEDDDSVKQSEENKPEAAKDETTHHDKKHGHQDAKTSEGAQSVYLTLGERRVGTCGRAFNFPVDVDHDSVTAKLYAGVLRLTVPKVPGGSKIDKHVTVQTGESHETTPKGVVAAV